MNIQLKGLLICFFQFLFLPLFGEKVLIFTYSYNRPDFIEIQHKTFQKFLHDDYEFVVFNDAAKEEMKAKIEETCANLNIRCINIPQEIHDRPYLKRWPGENYHHPTCRNVNVVQYSLDTLGFFHNGIVALFDSDLFLVKDFSIEKYLGDNALSGHPQIRKEKGITIDYIWIGLVFFDMNRLPDKEMINFNAGVINGINVDAGGHTYFYLQAHPEVPARNLGNRAYPFVQCSACVANSTLICSHNRENLEQMGFDQPQIDFIQQGPIGCEFFGDQAQFAPVFMHYRGGTNWDNRSPDFHIKKTKMLNDYINEILEK